jgi:hypothetical protein
MITLRQALAAGAVTLALATVPTRLAAQEGRAAPARTDATVLSWFSAVWSDLAALFAAGTPPPPAKPGGPTTQDACSIDPWGRCVGG